MKEIINAEIQYLEKHLQKTEQKIKDQPVGSSKLTALSIEAEKYRFAINVLYTCIGKIG